MLKQNSSESNQAVALEGFAAQDHCYQNNFHVFLFSKQWRFSKKRNDDFFQINFSIRSGKNPILDTYKIVALAPAQARSLNFLK
jgi:hypothetical protein